MSISQNFPNSRPSLVLNFARSKKLDKRITFTRSSTATYVDEDGLIKSVSTDFPRFDHNPTTGESLGLLIEEARTNLVSYSSYNASAWSNVFPANATLTTGITAPDGTSTAVRLTCATSGSSLLRVTIPSFTPNGTDTYTTSFYVRLISGNTSTSSQLTTDLADGSPSGNYLPNLITNQWVRVSFSAIPTATAKSFIDLLSDNTNNYVLDFWGVQIENGAFATSYIPTTSATVTRSADNASITGTNFASWYNQSEGTYITSARYDGTPISGVLNRSVFSGYSDSTVMYWNVWWETPNAPGFVVENPAGTYLALLTSGSTLSVGNKIKTASAYKTNDFAFTVDGASPSTDTSGSITSTGNTLYIGNLAGSTWYFCGRIAQISYYPTRLSNTLLQQLTK